MESISKVLTTSFGGYSLEHILSAVITLLVCLLAVRLIMRAVEKLMGRVKQPNERLLQLLELCDDLGIRYDSHFPVTAEIPYSYNMDALDSSQQKYFRSFLDNRDYDLDISAQTLMKKLRAGYRIPSD